MTLPVRHSEIFCLVLLHISTFVVYCTVPKLSCGLMLGCAGRVPGENDAPRPDPDYYPNPEPDMTPADPNWTLALTYGFGRKYDRGTQAWSFSKDTVKWEGNPSISVQVARYMVALRKRKVITFVQYDGFTGCLTTSSTFLVILLR